MAYSSRVTLEEHLGVNGYQSIEYENGRYYENENGKSENLKDKLRATAPVMRLPYILSDKIYSWPTDIEGVVEDIPYNYFATLEQSSEFISSLTNDGFRVIKYDATSRVIYIEMEKERTLCRIIIYDNYLKVYMPRGK